MRRRFDIRIKDHRQQAYQNALWSLATPLHSPLGWFNYLHSRVLVWREMCWLNQDFPAASDRDRRGMLNESVHIQFLGAQLEIGMTTSSDFREWRFKGT